MTESQIEQYALDILANLGWQILHGPDIGPDGAAAERELRQVVLPERLRSALVRLNPHIPEPALKEAMRRLTQISKPSLIENNHDFHQLLVAGVPVQYRTSSGETKHDIVRAVDFTSPHNNDFAAVNQLTVLQGDYNRRPDIVLFVNGLPLVVIELKNAADTKADLVAAYQQIQTYKREISDLFRFNELCVTSDGLEAEMGTITSPLERMMPWKTIDGEKEVGNVPMLEVLLRGVCMPERLLDVVQNFIVFERSDGDKLIKKVAAYHQYWVVNKALDRTLTASSERGDQRAGVVWHTQGSGKSLSMVFYTGKLMKSRDLHNPTIVVVTDAEYRSALKQIVDKAIAPVGVVDVFEAAGLEKPELSILSDEFLAEIRNMERKNLAVEALQKLLTDEIKLRFSRNYAKDTKFSDLLNQALTRYRNGTIEAAQVIEELINIGQQVRQTVESGVVDGLSEDEVIFYDALVENGSAREVLGDAQLRDIAKVLLEQVRRDATIDWAERKNVQAKLKVNVKKTLAKYGYPPDQQALATDMVLEQAKRYGNEWSHKRAAYDAGGASLLD